MLQAIRHTPKWFANALKPQGATIAGLRYRVKGWMGTGERALSEAILQGIEADDDDFRNMSFTFAVIALSARVAMTDGELTRGKYIAFREYFPLKGGVCAKIRSLFKSACLSRTPVEHYAMQVKYVFPERAELYASLVDRLFRIAAADGGVSRESERLLASVARTLDIPASTYADILSRYDRRADPHAILGVAPNVRPKALKKRYRELMQRYHPDRFAGQNLSPEVEMLLQAKASEINSAYRQLSRRAA